jgi:hypothetical protein
MGRPLAGQCSGNVAPTSAASAVTMPGASRLPRDLPPIQPIGYRPHPAPGSQPSRSWILAAALTRSSCFPSTPIVWVPPARERCQSMSMVSLAPGTGPPQAQLQVPHRLPLAAVICVLGKTEGERGCLDRHRSGVTRTQEQRSRSRPGRTLIRRAATQARPAHRRAAGTAGLAGPAPDAGSAAGAGSRW